MCIDMWIGMWIGICVGICVGMCVDMCIDMRIGTRIDLCTAVVAGIGIQMSSAHLKDSVLIRAHVSTHACSNTYTHVRVRCCLRVYTFTCLHVCMLQFHMFTGSHGYRCTCLHADML